MSTRSDNLLDALNEVGPAGSIAAYETDPDLGLMFQVRWTNEEGEGVCSVHCQYDEPNFIFNTITVADGYQQSGILKSMCRVIPKFCRENGFQKIFVPSITSTVTLNTLSNNGFVQNESGNWIADVSDPDNPVEAYGNS